MEEQQKPTVNNNRAYSTTVLHKVLAWCLSLYYTKTVGECRLHLVAI